MDADADANAIDTLAPHLQKAQSKFQTKKRTASRLKMSRDGSVLILSPNHSSYQVPERLGESTNPFSMEGPYPSPMARHTIPQSGKIGG